MKANYIPAVLVSIIPMMVNAQVRSSRTETIPSSHEAPAASESPQKEKSRAADLVKQLNYHEAVAKRLREAAAARKSNEKEAMISEAEEWQKHAQQYKDRVLQLLSYEQTALLKQAAHFDSIAEQTWFAAAGKGAAVKKQAIDEIARLRSRSSLLKIEASVISSVVSHLKYYNNNIHIDSLIGSSYGYIVSYVESLSSESEMYFRRAGEMRAEASELETNGARLGMLMNAEEQEYIALQKQREAIEMLTRQDVALVMPSIK